MATTEAVKKSPSKSRPKKERAAPKSASGTERLKTVVRRLPPNLPEEIFWQSVQNWVTNETVLWKAFFAGKQRKKLNKENVSSRAYIAFKTDEMLATFSREYDGHIYRDKAGVESRAVVEFAPYQKVPLEKKKVDNRNNTIDKDEDFISFLQTLEAPENKPHDAETLMEVLIASTQKPTAMPTSTPLLEALKAEKSAQKDKEAIQRNHAHYKETAAKKDDAKKKAAPAAKQGDAPATTGKKAGKKAAAAAKAAQAQAQAGASQSKPASASTSANASPSKAGVSKGGRGARPPPAQPQLQEPQLMKRPATPSADAQAQPPPVAPKSPPAGTQDGGARRARPTLGLGSRQFEAALNGAGVAKPKRERQADKDGEKGKTKEGGKGRSREQRQEQPGAAKLVAGILQRDGQGPAPRILAKPAESEGAGQATGAGPSDGGKGRSRGRGRGKGPARGG